jgi:hypothetical protein
MTGGAGAIDAMHVAGAFHNGCYDYSDPRHPRPRPPAVDGAHDRAGVGRRFRAGTGRIPKQTCIWEWREVLNRD